MRLPRARPWLIVCGALIAVFGAACSSPSGDPSAAAAPPPPSLPVLDDDACDPTRPPLAVAPDGTSFLALSQGFILSRYDAGGCHVDDLVRGINIGTAFDVAWSPAGDRYAYAIVAPPQTPGLTALRVSYFEFRARAPGEFGRDPYRAISGHAFPRGGEAWRWHGRRTGAASRC